ncbi:hypothetical protein CLD02_14400, partial [Klebsiella pneumoniae]
ENSTYEHLSFSGGLPKYLQVKEKISVNLGRVLHKLYSTGSIKEAEIVLEAIKAQAGVTA